MRIQSQLLLALVLISALQVSFCEDIYTKNYEKASQIVSRMTLKQKLGQMTQPDLGSLSSDNKTNFQKIKELGLGSVLVGGNGSPTDDGNLQTGTLNYTYATSENWKKLGDRLMQETVIEVSLDDNNTEVAQISLLLGTDAVHGNQHVLGEVLFPHNIGLAATFNPQHFFLQGQITANNTLASGWNYLFAPTVAVSHNAQWGRYYETLGQYPEMIKEYAYAFVTGAQQVDQNGNIRGAMTSTKHFLGDGATYEGRDEGDDKIYNYTSFLEHNIQGYRGGIEAQTGTIMCSYSGVNNIPMAINGDLLQNVLKEKEGFNGFIISDYNEREKVASQGQPTSNIKMSQYESTCLIVNAGMDMMMMGGNAEGYLFDLEQCVQQGEVAIDRIDDAVKRILAVKLAMGVVQIVNKNSNTTSVKTEYKSVDPAFAGQAALQAAEESLVLLKNENNQLPINLNNIEYVILIGERDIQEVEDYQVKDEYVVQDTNNMGAQNGGWSIRWQGYEGNEFWQGENKNRSSAFTIYDSLVKRLGSDRVLKPNYSDIRNYTSIRQERADFIQNLRSLNLTSQNTIIIGSLTESPYAEFMGEINNTFCGNHTTPPVEGCLYVNGHSNTYMPYLQRKTLNKSYDDFSLQVLNATNSNIPLITVLLTGRSMIVNNEIDRANAFIAAWLPGTTGGEAIVKSIFGEYLFGQNGYSNRLPVDWVQDMQDLQQFPIYNHKGDFPQIKNPLFKKGFGIYTAQNKQKITKSDH